jgi:putative oxidoreductase
LQKLLGGDFQFADPIGIGPTPSLFLTTIGEVICPILVIIGFKTRWASLPVVIVMAVAAFIVHGADPFGKKELALMYLAVFVVIMLLGPGRYSIDKK